MLNQKLVRGSLFMGTLVPSPARQARHHSDRHRTEFVRTPLERARTENVALRQRLEEQGQQLRHATLLLDACRAENRVMRRNIADLMRVETTPSSAPQSAIVLESLA